MVVVLNIDFHFKNHDTVMVVVIVVVGPGGGVGANAGVTPEPHIVTTTAGGQPVDITLRIVMENIESDKLTKETSTAVLMAVKEAISIEAGDDAATKTVHASIQGGSTGTELVVSAAVHASNPQAAINIHKSLTASTTLKESIASWVSWAQGVKSFATGSIRVRSVTVGDLPQTVVQQKMEAAGFNWLRNGESPLLTWVASAFVLIACFGCIPIAFMRGRIWGRRMTRAYAVPATEWDRLAVQSDSEVACGRGESDLPLQSPRMRWLSLGDDPDSQRTVL